VDVSYFGNNDNDKLTLNVTELSENSRSDSLNFCGRRKAPDPPLDNR
jgi:hypothetical protein